MFRNRDISSEDSIDEEKKRECIIAVSVIVPVYNAEKYIKECLDSVVNQTLQNIEIICIDDGSTDDSVSQIQMYNDDRILLLKQQNSGSGAARNNGIKHAKGEYVIFMDPDDYYPNENVLEELYTTAKEKNVWVCGGNIVNLDQQNSISKGRNYFENNGYINFYDFQDCGFHVRYIINRDMLLQNNIFYPNYRRYQDPPFLLRVMLCAKQFYAINKEVYVYRLSDGSEKSKYKLPNVCDLMMGLADVLRISSEHSLEKVHKQCWNNLFQIYGRYIYYYMIKQEDEIVEAAEKIDAVIDLHILNKTEEEAYILNSLNTKYFQDLYEKQLKLDRMISNGVPIIIYGAGNVGNKILSYVNQKGAQVMGVAVTKKSDKESNALVKEIEEYLGYKDSALIVVAVSENYQGEIVKHLEKLKFKNILCLQDVYPDFE